MPDTTGTASDRAARRRPTLLDTGRAAVPSDPAMSPDGQAVVYVLHTTDTTNDRNNSALWMVGPQGRSPRALTYGTADAAPRWSPDGRTVAFLRGDDGPGGLYLLRMDGPAEPRKVTEMPLGAGPPVWSPDGTRIACLAPADTGFDERAPFVADTLAYPADRLGPRRQVFVVDATSGEARQVTRGEWGVVDVAWHPDGSSLAVTAPVADDADLTGTCPVGVVDVVAPDSSIRTVGLPDGWAGTVSWLPGTGDLLATGRTEGVIGHQHLLRIPAAGGDPVTLAKELDRNVMPGGTGYPGGRPQCTEDGSTVVFCARDRGCTHVYTAPVSGGPATKVLGDTDTVVSGLSVAPGAPLAACVVATPRTYGEIVLLDLASGDTRSLTAHTAEALPEVEPYLPRERTFHAPDGTAVHGWVLRDPDAATPAPLLLDVHGGPHNAWDPARDVAHDYQQVLAARGWTVLSVNPRGSDGYGEDFFTGVTGGWGEFDEEDFLAAVDELVAEGVADPSRLAVHGYSYGGFMTCWLTGHTDRFAAAVAGGAVTDPVGMLASDEGYVLAREENRALPWSDPDRSAAQYPYSRVGDVTAPTLLLHGAADDTCPPVQAEQWFVTLRARGVPTRMVLYPGASHLFILTGLPSHRLDYGTRLVDWLERHTNGGET